MFSINSLLMITMGFGVFALGSIYGQLNVILKALAITFFLPKLMGFKFKIAEVLVIAFFLVVALAQVFLHRSFSTLTLELSFLLNVVLLVLIDKLPLRKPSVTDKLVFNFFCLSALTQIVYFFLVTGEGMLLRGDRNHTAVILTLLMFGYSYFYTQTNLAPLLIVLNKSRNFLVGILVFVFRDKFSRIFLANKFLMFSFFFAGLFAISYIYFYMLTLLEITNYGSENNLSRLFVVFDGSNSYRFKLNNDFVEMVIRDYGSFFVRTGVYSELVEVLGLYPHNSFLQLIYRAGFLRAVVYVVLIVMLLHKHNAALMIALFCQSMFIHDVLSTNVILLAFILSKFNARDRTCLYSGRSQVHV